MQAFDAIFIGDRTVYEIWKCDGAAFSSDGS